MNVRKRNTSISTKLKLMIIGITLAVTFVAFFVLSYNQYNLNKKDLENNLIINAGLIADYSVTTIIFNDPNGAKDILEKIKQVNNIVEANLFDSTGILFATYKNKKIYNGQYYVIPNFKDSLFYEGDIVHVIKTVKYNDTVYGYLQLVANTKSLFSKFQTYLYFLVGLMLFIIVITYLLANFFQKSISKPILKLARTAEIISQTNDYAIRVKPIGNDEIAELYNEFNLMLDKLRIHQLERDFANQNLAILNSELENRVTDRTQKLKEALQNIEMENDERKKAQLELTKLNFELEISKNSMYEDALQLIELNNKLTDSEKELKQMNEMKDKFFSIIAHDLKNPLTVIMGSVDLLQIFIKNNNLDKIETQFGRLKYGVLSFRNLLNNLLDWASTQSGNIRFDPIKFDINILIKDIVISIIAMAEQKNIEIAFQNTINEINVFADQNMINTVIRNLLTNAVKFTNNNGKINIKTLIKEDYAEISISDNGIGLSSDDLLKLFRIDVNVASIGRSKEKGTGLGLIICKEFINTHKINENTGNLLVSSTPGEGTTFSFTLSLSENK